MIRRRWFWGRRFIVEECACRGWPSKSSLNGNPSYWGPNVPSNVLRSIAEYAGVHIYSYSDDVLYADRNFICIHTVKPGEKRIFLPRKADVYDEISGNLIAKETKEFTDKLEAGETKLYYYS